MSLANIEKLYEQIEKSIFTIEPVFNYSELALKFVELSQAIKNFDGKTEEWIYLGEGNFCSLDDMIIGAYWHFTNWHAGQSSDSYLALSSLGEVFDPGMSMPPSDEPEDGEENECSADCYRLMNKMAEEEKAE